MRRISWAIRRFRIISSRKRLFTPMSRVKKSGSSHPRSGIVITISEMAVLYPPSVFAYLGVSNANSLAFLPGPRLQGTLYKIHWFLLQRYSQLRYPFRRFFPPHTICRKMPRSPCLSQQKTSIYFFQYFIPCEFIIFQPTFWPLNKPQYHPNDWIRRHFY